MKWSQSVLALLFTVALSQSVLAQEKAAAPAEKAFKNESGVGFHMQKGNSKSQSLNLRQHNEYHWGDNGLLGRYQYSRHEANEVETAVNSEAILRFDRRLSPKWSLFISEGFEKNKNGGFDPRYNSEIGARYIILQDEMWRWATELAYRYVDEKRPNLPDYNASVARIYMELATKWTETFDTKVWIEYLPNFSHSEDYRTNAELEGNMMLTRILSLSLRYTAKFNNNPPEGAKQPDEILTTNLVARF